MEKTAQHYCLFSHIFTYKRSVSYLLISM